MGIAKFVNVALKPGYQHKMLVGRALEALGTGLANLDEYNWSKIQIISKSLCATFVNVKSFVAISIFDAPSMRGVAIFIAGIMNSHVNFITVDFYLRLRIFDVIAALLTHHINNSAIVAALVNALNTKFFDIMTDDNDDYCEYYDWIQSLKERDITDDNDTVKDNGKCPKGAATFKTLVEDHIAGNGICEMLVRISNDSTLKKSIRDDACDAFGYLRDIDPCHVRIETEVMKYAQSSSPTTILIDCD